MIGTGIGGIRTLEARTHPSRRGADRVSPLSIPLLMSNAAAGAMR